MKSFDLVNHHLTDDEIKELQALCANNISDMLADINEPKTYRAAIRWVKRCATEMNGWTKRNSSGEYNSSVAYFQFNHPKFDKRYNFQTDYYTVLARRLAILVLEFEHRWNNYSLLEVADAISDGIQQLFESGRKIPQNQLWEQDFEVDMVLWRLTTATANVLIQRDTPRPAGRMYIPPEIQLVSIIQYVRLLQNACAFCATVDEVYDPSANGSLVRLSLDGDEKSIVRCRDNLSRLLPGIIHDLTVKIAFIGGNV